MSSFTLHLAGTTPLLLHCVHRHEFRNEIASNPLPDETPEQEAGRKMSRDIAGNPAVPTSWIIGALRAGTSRLYGAEQSAGFRLMSEIIELPEHALPLQSRQGDPVWSVYQSMQHLKPGSQKGITVIAPMFSSWLLEIPIVMNDERAIAHGISHRFVERAFNEAGKVGIGLFRPPKKHFGQFRVT